MSTSPAQRHVDNLSVPSQVIQLFTVRAEVKYRILNTEREVQSCVMAFGNQVKQNSKQKQGNSTQTKQEK